MLTRPDITTRFAELVAGTRDADIPAQAKMAARRAIADCIGGALAGIEAPVSRIAREVTARVDGPATVWGSGRKSSLELAAFANGVTAHAHAIDDTNESMRGHPTVPILPAVLVYAEAHNLSGRDLLRGYVVGVEIAAKLGRIVNEMHSSKGWHTTATLGVVGAAAGTAALADASVPQIRASLALATAMASGAKVNFGTMGKAFGPGNAARNGVFATSLALSGMEGAPEPLAGLGGFLDLYCGAESSAPQKGLENLGSPWEIVVPGVIPKLYPNCSLIHTLIDMARAIRAERPDEIDGISTIICTIGRRLDWMRTTDYRSLPEAAKFSVEYAVAHALLHGRLGIDDFSPDKLADPRIGELAGKVQIAVVDDLCPGNHDYTELDIVFGDGSRLHRTQAKPYGHPSCPLTDADFRAKFMELVGMSPLADRAEAIWAAVEDVENLPARTLTQLLAS